MKQLQNTDVVKFHTNHYFDFNLTDCPCSSSPECLFIVYSGTQPKLTVLHVWSSFIHPHSPCWITFPNWFLSHSSTQHAFIQLIVYSCLSAFIHNPSHSHSPSSTWIHFRLFRRQSQHPRLLPLGVHGLSHTPSMRMLISLIAKVCQAYSRPIAIDSRFTLSHQKDAAVNIRP